MQRTGERGKSKEEGFEVPVKKKKKKKSKREMDHWLCEGGKKREDEKTVPEFGLITLLVLANSPQWHLVNKLSSRGNFMFLFSKFTLTKTLMERGFLLGNTSTKSNLCKQEHTEKYRHTANFSSNLIPAMDIDRISHIRFKNRQNPINLFIL